MIIIYVQIWLQIIFDLSCCLDFGRVLTWLAILRVELLNLNILVITIYLRLVNRCVLFAANSIPNGILILHATFLSWLAKFSLLIRLNSLTSTSIRHFSLDLLLSRITSLLSKPLYWIKLLYRRRWSLCWINISEFSFKTLCKWRLLLAHRCLIQLKSYSLTLVQYICIIIYNR